MKKVKNKNKNNFQKSKKHNFQKIKKYNFQKIKKYDFQKFIINYKYLILIFILLILILNIVKSYPINNRNSNPNSNNRYNNQVNNNNQYVNNNQDVFKFDIYNVGSETEKIFKNKRVLMISASDRNSNWVEKVRHNHRKYAKSANMRYESINNLDKYIKNECEISGTKETCQKQWTKIPYLMDKLKINNSENEVVIWIDDDIVITKNNNFLKKYIDIMIENDAHFLVAEDPSPEVSKTNTGIIIVRNTNIGRGMLQKIWMLREDDNGYLGTCKNQSCLHEQQALNMILDDTYSPKAVIGLDNAKHYENEGVIVVPQKNENINLNNMYRVDHYDYNRKIKLQYNDGYNKYDKDISTTCHVSGMASKGCIHNCNEIVDLRGELIDECLLTAEKNGL